MYFKNRKEAGQKLAAELIDYRFENTAVLALSPGGVVVGLEIATMLHAPLSLLLVEPISLPGVGNVGSIDQSGNFTYGDKLPMAVLEEYVSEMRAYVEGEKIEKLHEIGELLGEKGVANPQALTGRNIVIVNDGLPSGSAFEAAIHYLKPIRTEKLIGAVPVASVGAVDRLHILCDEIKVLNVAANFMGTNHYYEEDDVPDQEGVQEILNNVITSWS